MKDKTNNLIIISVVTALGGVALAGVAQADHGGFGGQGRGMDLFDDGPFGMSAAGLFETIDADGDGTLTQAEIDAFRIERLEAHDANGDGNLSLDEFSELWQEFTQPMTVRVFQMLDADGDAIITREEYDRPFGDIVQRLDTDGDGSISQDEQWDDDDGRRGRRDRNRNN
ncbi:MAG: EF-hand domain-containing protein [Rhodobacteraceae bacterium]|nr:EF-hand domain-containing protein [Paracoccaceae bacterium]